MAREEHDREDLLREATALVERIELQLDGVAEPVVVGFRRDGAASFFWGPDPVFQFNAQAEFRRGYRGGKLLKAHAGKLVAMERNRTADEVQLLATEYSADETRAFLTTVRTHLDRLQHALAARQFQIIGQVPPDTDVLGRVQRWLAAFPATVTIAAAPNVVAKKKR